jgi:hypothetical protein
MYIQTGPTTPYSTGRKMHPNWTEGGGENFLSRGESKAKFVFKRPTTEEGL